MDDIPLRLFLDTNVYIIGLAHVESPEARLLEWAGLGKETPGPVEIVMSQVLIDQILRVAKRLRNKDWGGEVLGRIWQDLSLQFVVVDPLEQRILEEAGIIPREDVGVYLTARNGKADCFISSNRKLVRALVEQTREFECLTPENFIHRYMTP
jgi:predicted nucleic acid-binding protein